MPLCFMLKKFETCRWKVVFIYLDKDLLETCIDTLFVQLITVEQ